MHIYNIYIIIYIYSLCYSYATLGLGHHNKIAQMERKRHREREGVDKSSNLLNDNFIYITNQPVEGKCIQHSEQFEWGTALHSCATNCVTSLHCVERVV